MIEFFLRADRHDNHKAMLTTPKKILTPEEFLVLKERRYKRKLMQKVALRKRKNESDPEWLAWRADIDNRRQEKELHHQRAQERFNHPDRFLRCRYTAAISECRRRKKKNFEWRISFDEFKAFCSQPCTYCEGVLGKVKFGKGLDRIDTNGHYEKDNVLPCCRTCNRIRGDDLTVGETRSMIKHLLDLRRGR